MRRLERGVPAPDVAPLADGTREPIAPGERLNALLAALEGEAHPLHELLPKLSEEADPGLLELGELVSALTAGEGGRRA